MFFIVILDFLLSALNVALGVVYNNPLNWAAAVFCFSMGMACAIQVKK